MCICMYYAKFDWNVPHSSEVPTFSFSDVFLSGLKNDPQMTFA